MTTAEPLISTLLSATVPREALLEKLELAVLVKPLLTIGALVEAREGSLRITADNLEILVRVEVPATVEREGSAVLSAARLLKVVKNAGADEVALSAKDEKAFGVACGALSSTLACRPLSEFPQRPAWPVAATFEIPNIRSVLAWLSPVLNDDGRAKGIHFVGAGEELRIEALDGRQLHCVTLESPAVINAIAPSNLIKLAKVFEPDGGCTVEATERAISFRTGKVLIRAQLLEDRFPDTRDIIPKRSDKVFILPKSVLENALEAAGAVLEKTTGPAHVNISVKPTVTTIRTPRCVAGSVETVIETPNPFPIDLQISPARLLNAIKHVDADEVVIQCEDPLRSACIRHGDFLSVIATMHVP